MLLTFRPLHGIVIWRICQREGRVKGIPAWGKRKGDTGIDGNGLIASFTVDHERLQPGIYLSRMDTDPATGSIVTTFDIRMTAPNREPVLDTATIHAIEHLGATYLRNESNIRERVVYFGPMGCRTGFYLILFG